MRRRNAKKEEVAPLPEQPETTGSTQEDARERLLQAALQEFGAKGYAGARTARIAAVAKVNPQLISYYFGGKRGLLAALRTRWMDTEETLVPPASGYRAALEKYFELTLQHPHWARLVLWQSLDDEFTDPDSPEDHLQNLRSHYEHAISRTIQRQQNGEITSEVAPEFVQLLSHALAFAPVALPRIVEGILGHTPTPEEYQKWCIDQLMKLLSGSEQA
ncbi:TetR/AcrR family transcriptional regulator [Deinococcus cellulosilyticus]|uniref:TetR/AcrR family transcriptional regulator n=1 Tax=Deinococcus cellulosilyticus TaxID=401558 RepID=UPI001C9965D3|nr:TetR/AcrR family transcriptional regulator [Deinococcus cellulosilyticus]